MSSYAYGTYERREISCLKGLTLLSADYSKDEEEIRFTTNEGRVFVMYHQQDCCEWVGVEDIIGNLDDLIGTPILLAEEVDSGDTPPPASAGDYIESYTWTFYRFRTVKGDIDIRWFGSSNGYYSEAVDFIELNAEAGR